MEGIVKRKIQFTRNRVTAFGSINLSFLFLIPYLPPVISRYASSFHYRRTLGRCLIILKKFHLESFEIPSVKKWKVERSRAWVILLRQDLFV